MIYWLIYLCALMPSSARPLTAGLARLDRWCETKGWFRWPAELSYSGYLIHGIVFVIVFGWPTTQTRSHQISTLRYGVIFLLMLALVCAIGIVLHKVIEKPGIKAGKRLLEKLLRL